MTRLGRRFRTALTVFTAGGALAGAALTGAAPASGAEKAASLAPGVVYTQLDIPSAKGMAHAHVLTVDLRNPRVRVDLLHPGAVASRAPVSELADSRGAVAGVNGDFFDITETQHPGVEATGATVGPEIASGRGLKGAVPDGQRFGPALPPGTNTEEVFGVGVDGRARLDHVALEGSVRSAAGTWRLGGLNQYALPVGSVGEFTSDWGGVSRVRATCGTDTDRAAPCSTRTWEVTLRRGRVVSTTGTPGSGPIARGTTVLVGREAGAGKLRKLSVGERVGVRHRLVAKSSRVPFRFAIGGYPMMTGGVPLPGLDDRTSAVRTAVGFSDHGHRMQLLALDGAPRFRAGLTIAEVTRAMRRLGSQSAFSLDGGGSTTMVARPAGADGVSVLNHPSGGAERPVPNGIGVFTDLRGVRRSG